jgi:beta-carotene 15,15'-monooxygenase
MSMDQPVTEWATAIMKFDTETGDTVEFDDGAEYFGEPVFVPAPDGRRDAEDDGVVLTVGLAPGADRSRLFVLDGTSFTERARVTLPHALPFDFHGRYFPELRA